MGDVLTSIAVWFDRQDATRENSHLVVTVDRWLDRVTRGQVPLLQGAGLPTLTLHVAARKSVALRGTSLLGASWGTG